MKLRVILITFILLLSSCTKKSKVEETPSREVAGLKDSCAEIIKSFASKAKVKNGLAHKNSWIQKIRRFRGQSNTAQINFVRRRIVHIDNLLTIGDKDAVVAELNQLFYRVESSHMILNYLDFGIANYSGPIVKQLEEQRSLYLRKFGRDVEEYLAIRKALKKISVDDCDDELCKQTAEESLLRLGLHDSEMKTVLETELKGLEKLLRKTDPNYKIQRYTYTKPQWEVFKKFMDESEDVLKVVYARRKWLEVQDLFWDLFSEPVMLKLMYKMTDKIPFIDLKKNKTLVKSVFKELIDIRARINHFPRITYLVRSKADISTKFEQLRNLAAADPDILVTFARRTDAQKLWFEMKEYAKDVPHVQKFLKEMIELEDEKSIANVLGEISVTGSPSPARNLVMLLINLTVAGELALGMPGSQSVHQFYLEHFGDEPIVEPSEDDLDIVDDVISVITTDPDKLDS